MTRTEDPDRAVGTTNGMMSWSQQFVRRCYVPRRSSTEVGVMWLGLGVRHSLLQIHARSSEMNACIHSGHLWLQFREGGQYGVIMSS